MAHPVRSFATRVGAIALNTWRETMRDRLLLGVLVFLAALQGLVFALDKGPAVLDMAIGLMTGVGALVAIFLGTSLVHKELDKRTVFIVLAKPTSRFEFLFGKFAGLMATLGLMVALMAAGLTALMLATGKLVPGVYALCLAFWVELGFVTAIALLFATMTSASLSALYAACLFALGHFGQLIRVFADTEVTLSKFNYYGGWTLYYVLPHFEVFGFANDVLYDAGVPWRAWGYALAYGAAMIAALLTLATATWEARELL